MAKLIKEIRTKAGTKKWQVNGRRYGARPMRPQFPTKEAAEDALAKMIAARGAGLNPTRRDVTFQMQSDAFLKNNAETLAGRSLRSYASCLRVHILPRFGARRVIDINTASIKTLLTEERAKGISPATVSLIRATLSVIFQTAVDDGLVAVNPVTAARVGNRGRKARAAANQSVPKERVFTQKQIDAILEWCAARDHDLHDFVFTLLRTGCRPGECRALRWQDIVGNKILIERALDDRNVIGLTKTGGKRAVDLSPALKDVLRLRLLKRPGAEPTSFVFGNGTPPTEREMSRRFAVALDECEIVGHSLYDCRHSFASILLARGAALLWVAKQLGHSNASITLKYYAHFIPVEGVDYIGLLDERAADATEREEMKAST